MRMGMPSFICGLITANEGKKVIDILTKESQSPIFESLINESLTAKPDYCVD